MQREVAEALSNSEGGTTNSVLHIAAQEGEVGTIKALRTHLMSSLDLNELNSENFTPLDLAIQKN